MRLNKTNMLAAIVTFVIAITPLPSQAQLNESGGYMQAIKKIESALPACEEALKRVDVNKISVSYQYGKLIERSRFRGLQYIKLMHENINDVKDELNIKETIILLDELQSLSSTIDTLISLLGNEMTFQSTSSSSLGLDWARALDDTQNSLSPAKNEFYSSIVDIAGLIDAKMKSCTQDSMDLFLSKPPAK